MELSRLLSARVLLYDLHTRKGKPPGNPLALNEAAKLAVVRQAL